RDDGLGFDINDTRLSLGHGLSNMQVRAGNAGGDVEITSEPNFGSTVLAWVPFNKPESAEKADGGTSSVTPSGTPSGSKGESPAETSSPKE
ncbi:MAG: hypothetical protein AAGU05_00755, partial [Anaerolineaceae bacterium]